MRIKNTLVALTSILFFGSNAQDSQETFSGTRILNGHSVETLKKMTLQFRIEHRFGDILPDWNTSALAQSLLGFDQASDIRFAFEYGITHKLMIGLGRSKGAGNPYRSLIDGFVKYRVLTQNNSSKTPISMTFIGSSTLSYMKASSDQSQVYNFPKFAHRIAYSTQINMARKFGERFSFALIPTYVHRNYVDSDDINGLFALGTAFNLKFSKEIGIIAEYYYVFHDNKLPIRDNNFNSLSAGFEYLTNGHIFKIVMTNSRGFNETQFIPGTSSDWLNGEFRLGFSITRNFKL
jgi:hypothetical protein